MEPPRAGEFAHIGKSVIIKGELSGSEDLYVDGTVDGSIELHGHSLTVGPNGKVRANVNAKGVVVQGRLEGNIRASERIELRSTGVAIGDISTQRVAIEEGAYLKGKVDIQRETPKPAAVVNKPAEPKPEAKSSSAAASASTPTKLASGAAASSVPSSTTVTKS